MQKKIFNLPASIFAILLFYFETMSLPEKKNNHRYIYPNKNKRTSLQEKNILIHI